MADERVGGGGDGGGRAAEEEKPVGLGERAAEQLTEAPAGRRRWGGRLQREQTAGMFNHHTSVRDMSLTAAARLDPPR